MVSNISSSSPPAYDNAIWTVVPGCEWNLDEGKTVRFLRAGDAFQYESEVNGRIGRGFYPLEGQSPEEIIAEVSASQPYINDDRTVEFLKKASINSELNPNLTIDESNWSVTVVNLGESISGMGVIAMLGSITTYVGHAEVIMETIEEGFYHLWRGDILPYNQNPKIARVRFEEIFATLPSGRPLDALRRIHIERNGQRIEVTLPENFPRTKTWIRTKALVQKMMAQMAVEKDCFEKSYPIIFFNRYGGSAWELIYNCIEWCKIQLLLAGINLTNPDPEELLFIETPVTYAGSFSKRLMEREINILPAYAASLGLLVLIGTLCGLAVPALVGSGIGLLLDAGLGAIHIKTNMYFREKDPDEHIYGHQLMPRFCHEEVLVNDDTRTMFVAVKQNGLALQFASNACKNNFGMYYIVYTAVKQNGLALQFATNAFQNDFDIVYTAVRQNGLALQFAKDGGTKDNDRITLFAVRQNGLALQFVSRDLLEKRTLIVYNAVQQNGLALQFAGSFQKHKRIVLAAIIQNGLALQFADPELKNNYGFVTVAMHQNMRALDFASEEIRHQFQKQS